MECYRCDRDAIQECQRCGALYCDEHGDALCERCMDPELALPSYWAYRGSLLALLAGSVFAVWLLVRPGGDLDSSSNVSPPVVPSVVTSADGEESPTPDEVNGAPGPPTATATPDETGTPSPTPTPSATPSPTPEPDVIEYTIVPGDTLSSIAAQFVPAGESVEAFATQIAQANNIVDPGTIASGDVLIIPR